MKVKVDCALKREAKEQGKNQGKLQNRVFNPSRHEAIKRKGDGSCDQDLSDQHADGAESEPVDGRQQHNDRIEVVT